MAGGRRSPVDAPLRIDPGEIDALVVLPPLFDHDLRLLQGIEELAV